MRKHLILPVLFLLGSVEFSMSTKYLGCYGDAPNRVMTKLNTSEHQTVDWCVGVCIAAGHRYAGLQFGEECFCGETYDTYGLSSDCYSTCRGNAQQICGGAYANSVYQTVPDVEIVMEERSMNWTVEMVNTSVIGIPQFTAELRNLIEHPLTSSHVIAATDRQLVEFSELGQCTVIAGVAIPGCIYSENNMYLKRVVDMANLNLERLKKSGPLVAIADAGHHCIKTFNFQLPLNHGKIGNCGDDSTMSAIEQLTLQGDIRISEPKMIAVAYFEDLVRIVISCKLHDDQYLVVVNYYSSTTYAFQYFVDSQLIIPIMSWLYGVLRVNVRDTVHCTLLISTPESTLVYEYFCPYSKAPMQVSGQLFVPTHGFIEQIVWFHSGSVLSSRPLQLSIVSRNDMLEMVATSTNGRGGIWAYSSSAKAFYLFKSPVESRQLERSRYKFHRVAQDHLCDGEIVGECIAKSLESCTVCCIRDIACYAISYNIDTFLCMLHASQRDIKGVSQPGTDCFYV